MRILLVIIYVLFFCGNTLTEAQADDFEPVVIYQGDIANNSFNIAVHKGVERFWRRTGFNCTEVVVDPAPIDYEQAIRKYADSGYSPILVLYGNHFPDLVKFARSYPATRFIVLDAVRDEPNLYSFVLADHEGAFLAGALAAMATESGILGFVSVVDTPFQRRFLCGFVQGAKYVNPDIEVREGFTGDYPGSWYDGNATFALANEIMDEGADVLFQAAGGAGPAVLKAAAMRGCMGIGVDINQNGLYPGSVLTSMVKHTDKSVFAALMLALRNVWRDNYKRLGLAQEAVGLVFDEHNSELVTEAMKDRVMEIKRGIVLGTIPVHDYTKDRVCP